jgi:hypothetical protein
MSGTVAHLRSPKYVPGLDKVPKETSRPPCARRAGMVLSEQVRLQPRLYDIKGARDDRAAHAPEPAQSEEVRFGHEGRM